MRKALFVGCGGTGGAVLAYLMDQLRSDLAREGIDRIPGGWQFVHVDVPLSPDTVASGLGSVQDQGGQYLSCGPMVDGYDLVDNALTRRLQQTDGGLSQIATWAPRKPEAVTVPVQVGAGQRRSVGRMLTLSKVSSIRDALVSVQQRLNFPESTAETQEAVRRAPRLGALQESVPPVVFVVSSMAGGAGASMALDICRLLAGIGGLSPTTMGLFMASADVFDGLSPDKRNGVRPNALAMLGEIIASQAGAASGHDIALLRAAGLSDGGGVEMPFARVFPVGRFVGVDQVRFGDGTMNAVYRGLGRGLAALLESPSALEDYITHDLGNPQAVPTKSEIFGWGAQDPANLQWGAFGYATLSMGRDRYAEYSAQRISRTCADHLLEGHMQLGNTAGSDSQARALVDAFWDRTCSDLGLPSGGGETPQDEFRSWLFDVAIPRQSVAAMSDAVVRGELATQLPSAQAGTEVAQFVAALNAALGRIRRGLLRASHEQVYASTYRWADELTGRLEEVVTEAVAQHGLAYTQTMLERLQSHCTDWVARGLEGLGAQGPADPAALPSSAAHLIQGLRGALGNGQAIIDKVLADYTGQVSTYIRAEWCKLSARVVRSFAVEVLGPMLEAVTEASRILENARADTSQHTGVARIATDLYQMWPSDGDMQVARRWAEADNEVLLTPSSSFMGQYRDDLPTSLPERNDGRTWEETEAREAVVSVVVAGDWNTTGGVQPPRGLVDRPARWRCRDLGTDPGTGERIVPSRATYDVHVRPAELLHRARLFVNRPGESFRQFVDVSLRQYAQGAGTTESGLADREAEIDQKFNTALTMALPLISVDNTVVHAVHGDDVQYRYKFSAVPFESLPISAKLDDRLAQNRVIEQGSVENFRLSMDQSAVTRIDIFGSYKNYSPLVFEGVLRPIVQQWQQGASDEQRHEFWQSRRARPLAAALPMGDQERRAMVAGWFLGQIVGELAIPQPPYTTPVRVWDREAGTWVAFPHPLLSPPRVFLRSHDWLPAVLESSLLALARIGDAPVASSLRPYQLLRGLFDDALSGPTSTTSGMSTRSGNARLATWVETGVAASGAESRVPGAEAGTTPEQRQRAAREWLGAIGNIVGEEYLPPGVDGATGGGEFSQITTREQAAGTPMFRDLAPDVWWAVRELKAALETEGSGDVVF